jgi:hypothetical protein
MGHTMSYRSHVLPSVCVLILLLTIVGCGKLHLQSVTIGNPHDTYNKPEPPPDNFTVYGVDTGDTLSCTRIGGSVTCTK